MLNIFLFAIRTRSSFVFVLMLALLAVGSSGIVAQEGRTLTFQDLMKVRQIQDPSISADGRWVALSAVPDRGDGEALVYSAEGDQVYSIPRGSNPVISADGRWVAARLEPSFAARETAGNGEAPRPGAVLLDTRSGATVEWGGVQRFAFSADGRWLARLASNVRDSAETATGSAGGGEAEQEGPGARTRKAAGATLTLRELASGEETAIPFVRSFLFDEEGGWVAFVVAAPDGEGDGVYLRGLHADSEPRALDIASFTQVETLSWWSGGDRLAWVRAAEDENGDAGPGTLVFWDGENVTEALSRAHLPDGWVLPTRTQLRWSRDGERLFYGSRPFNQAEKERFAHQAGPREGGGVDVRARETAEEDAFDPYDINAILRDRGVDVWNTDDPLINPNQKRVWSREQSRTYVGVFHVREGRSVQLGDTLVQLRGIPENPDWALAESSVPYLKESTWTGGADDLYLVNLESGERTLVVKGFQGESSAANEWIGLSEPSLDQSPGGRFVVWFQEDQWHLYDASTGQSRVLTAGIEVPFYDVDHDYPSPRGGHGIGGWMADDRAVLIYDKYDLWQFPTDGSAPVNLTQGRGRAEGLILRAIDLDPDEEAFRNGEPVLLASFDESDKSFGFFRTTAGRGGLESLLNEEERFRVLAKADEADRILFTREDYDEFPDVWVGNTDLSDRRRVSDVNPGLLDRFAWGRSELVEWTSDDGVPLEGVVILPGNYQEGKRYPVLTYFYRFFSQRLHEFNQPVINHRPSFPIYASDGYIVFLPDVRFEVGRPGLSAMKSVVPGVKKLVDLGLADPEALGLHGHSWSGYTTAFMVTQTNIFAAAVAGAPVSNMTSAYGGIRWGTGLARQFQYEMGQSRLSGSLWEAPAEYIENSPLFYADEVETPLVLMHGDEDDAVPWYQSIELYLALRRNGKKAVFLEYRGEPHHPQRYANKLDYSIKMKAFFDHFLKGAPAPDWWTEGVPYTGK